MADGETGENVDITTVTTNPTAAAAVATVDCDTVHGRSHAGQLLLPAGTPEEIAVVHHHLQPDSRGGAAEKEEELTPEEMGVVVGDLVQEMWDSAAVQLQKAAKPAG